MHSPVPSVDSNEVKEPGPAESVQALAQGREQGEGDPEKEQALEREEWGAVEP